MRRFGSGWHLIVGQALGSPDIGNFFGSGGAQEGRSRLEKRRHVWLWLSKRCPKSLVKFAIDLARPDLHEHMRAVERPAHLLLRRSAVRTNVGQKLQPETMKPCDRELAFSLRMLESYQDPPRVAEWRDRPRPCHRRHFTALMSLSIEGSSPVGSAIWCMWLDLHGDMETVDDVGRRLRHGAGSRVRISAPSEITVMSGSRSTLLVEGYEGSDPGFHLLGTASDESGRRIRVAHRGRIRPRRVQKISRGFGLGACGHEPYRC